MEETTEKGQEAGSPILAGPLPIWPILRDAVLVQWRNRVLVFRLLLFPVCLWILLDIVDPELMGVWDGKNPGFTLSGYFNLLFWSGVVLMAITNFAVHCHRLILLPSYQIPAIGIGGWSKRELRFFIWLMLGFLGYVVGSMAFGVFGAAISILWGKFDLLFGKWFSHSLNISMLPMAYILGRFSPIFPAVAVDLEPALKTTWAFTRGNGLRLAFLIWIIPTIFYDVGFDELTDYTFGILSQQVSNSWGVHILQSVEYALYFLAYSIEIAILSLCFKELSWWNGPRLETG